MQLELFKMYSQIIQNIKFCFCKQDINIRLSHQIIINTTDISSSLLFGH